ncbi:N/A [soil metagenome]
MSDVAVLLPRVAALFGAGGLCLIGARHRPDIAVLTARLRTWVVLAVIWFTAVAVGRPGVVTLAAFCGVVAAAEYRRLAVPPSRWHGWPREHAVLLLAGGALPLMTLAGGTVWLVSLALLLLAATVPPLLDQDVEQGLDRLARTVLGVLWFGAACSALAVLPLAVLPLVGLATAMADIGGFVGGAVRGRHRLAPRLSPGKTLEGVAGSTVLATIGVALCADVAGLPLWVAPPIGLAVALAATWGDLLESLLKRSTGCKDTGTWLPGFGGLLDRVDSLLVTAPVAWALLTLMEVL